MICSTCKEEGVLNYANNNPFYYCQSCKAEILLEAVAPFTTPSQFSFLDLPDVEGGLTITKSAAAVPGTVDVKSPLTAEECQQLIDFLNESLKALP